MECPNGICDRLQIAEWDVQTLISERDAAVLAATMELRRVLREALEFVERHVSSDSPWTTEARALLDEEADSATP